MIPELEKLLHLGVSGSFNRDNSGKDSGNGLFLFKGEFPKL
jgi:hypothetical protein